MNKIFFCLLISAVAFNPGASLAQEIGSGYSCSGTSIIKGGKVVSLSRAKAAIQAKIDSLPGAKNKNKRNALKAVKQAVINCSKGIPPTVAAGTYTGTISGAITKSLSAACEDRTSITGSLTVTGSGSNLSTTAANLFGAFFKGTTGVNKFTLTGASGVLVREFWTIEATDVTSTSALFTIKYRGVKIASRGRQFEVCAGNFSGTMTRS